MSVDARTRIDGEIPEVDPSRFFSSQLPDALAAQHESLEPGVRWIDPLPLTIEIDGERWTLLYESGRLGVRPGGFEAAAHVRITAMELAELVHDLTTPMAHFVTDKLDMPSGHLGHFLDWWIVLRAAIDGRAIHQPGAVTFRDQDGSPLDLRRSFRIDDPLEEMSHFLHEAGFLHIEGLFSEQRMAQISRDMDEAAPRYRDGDGESWWATTRDGKRQPVRLQGFDRHSSTTAELLEDPNYLRIGEITGDGHKHSGLENNRIEALVKPIGVVEGISDVPWHKDCSLGRHSYECASLTTGVSVTGAGASSGQLRVVAGSNRALIRPAFIGPGCHDLPEIDLPTRTGDVTVHLSDTLHMSQPPVERERRVLYTGFRLPSIGSHEDRIQARRRLREIRESAHQNVSQEPGT